MIARVARAYGQPALAVARAPFAETAWSFLQLLTLERFDALTRDGEGLQAASRVAIAFHEPRKLEAEHRGFLDRVRDRSAVVSVADARARLQRLRRSGAMNDLHAEPQP